MATFTKGKTFLSGETVTPQSLHDLVDKATLANIGNADISATAAISGTKISPNFGAQNIATTGTLSVTGAANLGPVSEVKATPSIAGSALSLNVSLAALFYVSLNSNVTVTFTGAPESPRVFSFMVQFVNDGTARTVTWPGSVRWGGGSSPSMTGTNGKIDTFSFLTHDGGVTWFGFVNDQNQ
jgi:hypothetical protein